MFNIQLNNKKEWRPFYNQGRYVIFLRENQSHTIVTKLRSGWSDRTVAFYEPIHNVVKGHVQLRTTRGREYLQATRAMLCWNTMAEKKKERKKEK